MLAGVLIGAPVASALAELAPVFPVTTPAEARTHGLESLRPVVETDGVPLPAELSVYIRDMTAARRLGKALFYEMAVGSDGIQSCASCHYRAGADNRDKNQLSPACKVVFSRPATAGEVQTPGRPLDIRRTDF